MANGKKPEQYMHSTILLDMDDAWDKYMRAHPDEAHTVMETTRGTDYFERVEDDNIKIGDYQKFY